MTEEELEERPETTEAACEEDEPRGGSARRRPATIWRDHRPKVLAAAAGLVATAVAGTVLTLAFTGEEPAPHPYTVPVTYQVTGKGSATIVYNTGDADAPGKRESSVDLPWTKKVRVDPKSGEARVSLILGKNGGRAACSLAIRGHHRQSASAFGSYGRATCAAKVPPRNS